MADDLDLLVVVDDGATEQEVRLAHGFWQITRVAGNRISFAHTMKSLAQEVGLRHPGEVARRVRAIAYATSPRVTCASCPELVPVRSRQQLQDCLNPPRHGTPLRCGPCAEEQERLNAERVERLVQRDAIRADIARDWLTGSRLAGETSNVIGSLSPQALLVAAVMIRQRISRPADLPWIEDLDAIVRDLHAHHVGDIVNTRDLFTWNSEDPYEEQSIRALQPDRARFRLDSLPVVQIEAAVRHRRHELAATLETHRAARSVLLEEMARVVAHALEEYDLPERDKHWEAALAEELAEYPTATLGQVATAAPQIASEAYAIYKNDLDIRPTEVASLVIQQVARHALAELPPSKLPHTFSHGILVRLIFADILARDILTASPARLLPEEAPEQNDSYRLAWTRATRAAGADAALSSRARDIVESAADLFTALVAKGMPLRTATQAAYHGTELLAPYVADDVLDDAQNLLRQALGDVMLT